MTRHAQRTVVHHSAPPRAGVAMSAEATSWPSARSSGAPLAPMMRSTMEGLLGYDLSDVRIHSDGAAATSARRMEARAYTVGDDIVLGGDVPSLRTRAGQHALAHELIHVVQQRLGGPAAGAEVDSPFEQDAEAAAMALADGRKPPPVVRGTAVGVARQPMDPRHARGYAGEQAMGFTHYKESEGWIFFEGPSGAGGHGVTQSGFDGVAYNTRTGEVHLADNKSLAATGNVSSATAIDPARNLGKNLDGLIQRVEATKDVPGRIRLLGLLRQTRAALTTGKPLPPAVKLVVTSEGGRTTGVSARLAAAGVEHLPPKPAPSAPLPHPRRPPPRPRNPHRRRAPRHPSRYRRHPQRRPRRRPSSNRHPRQRRSSNRHRRRWSRRRCGPRLPGEPDSRPVDRYWPGPLSSRG